jgi:hypothetical protein
MPTIQPVAALTSTQYELQQKVEFISVRRRSTLEGVVGSEMRWCR